MNFLKGADCDDVELLYTDVSVIQLHEYNWGGQKNRNTCQGNAAVDSLV